MSEYIVNGEILGALDYALRGMPPTDDMLPPPQPKGLDPYIPQRPISLYCAICGGDAGTGGINGTATDEEYRQAVIDYNVQAHFCPRHWDQWRLGKLPDYPVFPHPRREFK